jgi:hypothetical protein
VELIQIEQQDPRDTAVHTGGSLQELDPVAVRQMQVGGSATCSPLPAST